ncbi:MAG: serine/threonine-protein phosphatase [Lachnospiraceae bacterium]|nr:serine/threonine-protein phosphatase [Lachnospiraceae bacterium]
MAFILEAACLCLTGKVRKTNEDNFFFDGRCLQENNEGLKHPVVMEQKLRQEVCMAVFDGMGGMNYGEAASFAAAWCLQDSVRKLKDFFIPERKFLIDRCMEMNDAVLKKKEEFCTDYMGTTIAALYFTSGNVYVCNVGDSRAYRLREGEFMQISKDHVETQRPGSAGKPSLTQHLGISPDEFLIEPYIAKGELQHGDCYLLCSDGLTDMLTNIEIDGIMTQSGTAEECAERLADAALTKGGKDNITVIVCRII